jgi:hypothetical protein
VKCSSIERSSEPTDAHNGAVSLEKAHRTVIDLGELTDHAHKGAPMKLQCEWLISHHKLYSTVKRNSNY